MKNIIVVFGQRFLIVFAFFFVMLSSISYANFPSLELSKTNFETGVVNIEGRASSGTQIDLFINSDIISRKDIYSVPVTVHLNSSSINDQMVGIGSQIIFINNDINNNYTINITGKLSKILQFAQQYSFSFFEEAEISYSVNGIEKKLYFVDRPVDFSFNDMQTYLNHGENNISFLQKFPAPTFPDSKTYDFVINYNKFVNSIYVTNYTNVSRFRTIEILGSVGDNNYPLYYVVNMQPHESGNLGVLQKIEHDNNKFNVSISNLKEGINEIYFVTTDTLNPNIFTGLEKIEVLVDTIPPKINIINAWYDGKIGGQAESELHADLSRDTIFINGNRLNLNISVDAVNLTVIFNNKNTTYEVINDSICFCDSKALNLAKGQNNLTIMAQDIAGNVAKQAHSIWFDDTNIALQETDPKSGETVHFFVQDFSGKVNKRDVEVTVFTIPQSAQYWNPTTQKQEPVTCKEYEFLGVRDLDHRVSGRDRIVDPQLKPNDVQISLLSFVSSKKTAISDNDGNFKVKNVILQEGNIDSGDVALDSKEPPKVGNVKSTNKICFIMGDIYGNTAIRDISVTLDAGNTMWRPGEITTIPNTLYASEIEGTGDIRSGTGNVEFGMIARFEYIGAGKVNHLTSFNIRPDGKTDAKYTIDTSRMNFMLDKNTGELIVYVPIRILPQNIKPLDYPDSLEFAFAASVVYTLNDVDIPIDTINPIYFRTNINIERPLDHTKWLTPSMIESTQKFLNQSIKYTKTATEYMQWASIGGVLTCTGAKFWHAWEETKLIMEKNSDDGMSDEEFAEKKYKIDERLYMICDRIASTASPYECNAAEGRDLFSMDEIKHGIEYKSDDKVMGVFTPVVGGDCKTVDGKNGTYVSGSGKSFKDESAYGIQRTVESEVYFKRECLPTEFDKNNNVTKIDFGKINGQMCYSPKAPHFDHTRCNFFRFDNPEEGGTPGKDPATSIISSIQCGAIVDTYSHLKNFLKIQQGIYDCLEQAKIGDIKGSYCERLMGQAVCDIATNVILPELQQRVNPRTGVTGVEEERSSAFNFLGQMKKNEKAFDERYKGTFLSKAGLGTDQIINKACLAAITGDWSVLTDNILTAIDKNQVEPVFGPPFPESRLQGYNPITGDLSINYRFTYAALSGGQRIDTTIEFICDKNAPNSEYCPDDSPILSSQVPGSFDKRIIRVPEGGSKQETVVVTEAKARFWYNKIRMTHVYELKGKTQTEVREFPIIHKTESLLANCHFTGGVMGDGAGFRCDTIFGKDALISSFTIDERKTAVLPSKQNVYYPGNDIYLNLAYEVRNKESFEQDVSLVYMAVCNEGQKDKEFHLTKNNNPTPYFQLTKSNVPIISSENAIALFENLPEIGSSGEEEFLATLTAKPSDYDAIKITSLNGIQSPAFTISKILIDNKPVGIASGYVAQNLNVNKDNPQNPYVLIDSNFFKDYNIDAEIKIIFKNKPENIAISLFKKDNKIESQAFYINTNGINVQEGRCNLYLRLMPTQQASEIRKDNFKTYDPLTAGDSSIQYDSSLTTQDMVTKTFELKKRRVEDNFIYFDIIKPQTNFCINQNQLGSNVNMPIEYLYQTSNPNSPVSGSVSVSITAGRFGIIGVKDDINLKKGLHSESITIEMGKYPQLTNYLKNLSYEDDLGSKASSHILGMQQTVEGSLKYTLKDKDGKQVDTSETRLFIVAKDDCREAEIGDGDEETKE